MEYTDLIHKYPAFIYHDFDIVEDEQEIHIHYAFEIEGLSNFNPEYVFPKSQKHEAVSLSRNFRETVFSLGMVELISYWKLTCSPSVRVECGSLNDEQIRWWKKLYFHGLGEFFYRNHIETDMDSFMDLQSFGQPAAGTELTDSFSGNLIPVGGGKDSLVSLDLLKESREMNHAFIINHVMSAIHSAEAAGYDGDSLTVVSRSLDPRMLEFNKQGYLNGHTPFSALAAFASLLCAIAEHREYICLSNEDSANESTVAGSTVNHQYSKTFEFEKDFNDYCQKYITDKVHYFSLLRPLSELQIAGIFSTLPQYLHVFRSCNVGQKLEKWCGHCAKCLFVCIMLSAFLNDETVDSVFGRSMLNDEDMMDLFEQLTGLEDNKPFECVGTRKEVNIAVCMSIAAHKEKGEKLPLLYQRYAETAYYDTYKDRSVSYKDYNTENLLPPAFEKTVRERLSEMDR